LSPKEARLLSFTRKAGQGIRVGDRIRIIVKEVRGRQVRLVIEAPHEIPIFREEIWEQIAAENERAAQAAPNLLQELE
jgi:carbon storage regulator